MFSPQKTVTSVMILFKNTKVMVHSLDGNTDFINIVARVLQGDTLTRHLFIICQDCVLQILIDLIEENRFTLKKVRSRWYPTETITNTDNTDDLALLANTPAQAEFILHRLEQVAGSIGFYVNTNKIEFICFKRGDISTLKLVNQFIWWNKNI